MKRIFTLGTAAVVGALALTAGVAAFASETGDRAARHTERLDRMFEMLDVNNDGAIDLVEIEGAREARFTAVDTDGDGTLTVIELTEQEAKRAAKRVERMMERMDANGDGVIELVEYSAGDKKHGGKRGAKMLKRFDANGDGQVTREEAEAHIAAHHKKHDG